MPVEVWMPYNAHANWDDLDFDARSQWVDNCKIPALHALGNKANNIKLAPTVGHCLRDLDLVFTNVSMACPLVLIFFG